MPEEKRRQGRSAVLSGGGSFGETSRTSRVDSATSMQPGKGSCSCTVRRSSYPRGTNMSDMEGIVEYYLGESESRGNINNVTGQMRLLKAEKRETNAAGIREGPSDRTDHR